MSDEYGKNSHDVGPILDPGFIVNLGLAGQAVMPVVAGSLYASFGIYMMFGVVAGMFAVLTILAWFVPETFGLNLEELHGEA